MDVFVSDPIEQQLMLAQGIGLDLTLKVMGNLVDNETPGAAGRVLRLADRTLRVADPLLRRTRAAA